MAFLGLIGDKMTKALVLSPHPDDLELGAGGYIYKLTRNSNDVDIVYLTDCKESLLEHNYAPDTLIKESEAAALKLGIKKENIYRGGFQQRFLEQKGAELTDWLYKNFAKNEYDMVLTPWNGDWHADHEAVGNATLRIFKRANIDILMYEVLSCNEFVPNLFIPLTTEDLAAKIRAYNEYKSQLEIRSHMSVDLIRAAARLRGMPIMAKYAEAYILCKGVWKD